MYFDGLLNGQYILLSYYMLNIMFHLTWAINGEKNVLHISFHVEKNK